MKKNRVKHSSVGQQPAASHSWFDAKWRSALAARDWNAVGSAVSATAIFLLSFLLAVQFPRIPANKTCDLGCMTAYDYVIKNHYQFGIDVRLIIGPYGNLHFPNAYTGMLVGEKIAYGLFIGVVFATLILLSQRFFPTLLGRLLFYTAAAITCIPCGPEAGLDTLSYAIILLATHYFLTRNRYRSYRAIDVLLWCMLALISLGKSANLVVVALMCGLLTIQTIITKRYRDLLWDWGVFLAWLLIFWLLAGQRLSTIPLFLLSVIRIAGDYSESMAFSLPNIAFVIWCAVGIWILFIGANLLRLWLFRRNAWRLPLLIFEFAMLFITWKHGYVRADGHLMIFWTFIPLLATISFLAHEPALPPREQAANPANTSGKPAAENRIFSVASKALTAECIAVFFISFVALSSPSIPLSFQEMCALKVHHMTDDIGWIFGWQGKLARLDILLKNNAEVAALPGIQSKIGNDSVDVYGWMPGFATLNGLNFKPRPTYMSIIACSWYLMEANAEYYRNDATAPKYLIAEIMPLDDKLTAQNDAIALAETLYRYRPIAAERGAVLLKRVPNLGTLRLVPLGKPQTCTWMSRVAIPPHDNQMLWCRVDIDLSLIGRLRSFLYKPMPVAIAWESQGRTVGICRFLTAEAKTGFLIDPLVLNNLSLLDAYHVKTDGTMPKPDSFRFVYPPESHDDYQDKITVSFFMLKNQK